MRRRIHKVQLQVDWSHEIKQMIMMDIGAEVLSLGVQNELPVMWFSTPWPDFKPEPRIFLVTMTGSEYEAIGTHFIGTVALKDWYVAHVFECLNPSNDGADIISLRHHQDLVDIRRELEQENHAA